MGLRSDDHSAWARPDSDHQVSPALSPDAPIETAESIDTAVAPETTTRSRSRFWPAVAAVALATAGVGFVLGRSSDADGATGASATTSTLPPTVTIDGVTPPTPPPADAQATAAPESSRPIVAELKIDRRVIGPTKLVVSTTRGLIEVDLATGEVTRLSADETSGDRTLVVGDDWVVSNYGGMLLVQRDAETGLAPISGGISQETLWPHASPLGWVSAPGGTAARHTTWRQIDLNGEQVATVAVPDAAAAVGSTSRGIVAGYRGSTYLFNGDGARWIGTGEPIAANGDSIVMHVCTRATTCDLVVVDATGRELSSTPRRQPIPIRMYVGGGSSLSPDGTQLLIPALDLGDSAAVTATGLWLVDLTSGSTLEVDLDSDHPQTAHVAWTSDGNHFVVVTNGTAEVVDTTTGEQFPLVTESDELAGLGEWIAVTERP